MNPILSLITNTLDQKETENFRMFIDSLESSKKEWYLVSDFCIGEKDKLNDVFSFSLLQTDIKDINNPVAYHFSFAIPRENQLLEHFSTKENLIAELDSLNSTLSSKITEDPTQLTDYFLVIKKRSEQLMDKILSSDSDEILARKIILTGFFGASVINFVKKFDPSSKILWIADFNNEIVDTCDGFVFDFMFMQYLLVSSHNYDSYDDIDVLFELSGQEFLNDLIQIPHLIADTLADHFQPKQDFNNQTNIKIEAKNTVLSAESVR